MFEWDPKKALLNLEKHGVLFDETIGCFSDPGIVMGHDLSHSKQEDRYMGIARSGKGRLLAFVFTVRRLNNGEKIFRIISARHASKKERKNYPRS